MTAALGPMRSTQEEAMIEMFKGVLERTSLGVGRGQTTLMVGRETILLTQGQEPIRRLMVVVEMTS